jgi:methylglyoxal synthase
MSAADDKKKKTYIGVLSADDDPIVNESLVEVFNFLYKFNPDRLAKFHFIFTGGTYGRVIMGTHRKLEGEQRIESVADNVKKHLIDRCGVTCLPSYENGGITILSHFITRRLCTIVWPFFSSKGGRWSRPQNLAQMRLSDQWHVKRLMNESSVKVWFQTEAEADISRNRKECPPTLVLREGAKKEERSYRFSDKKPKETNSEREKKVKVIKDGNIQQCIEPPPKKFGKMTIALIAHDEMKKNMISFAIDHEWELRKFKAILATGTTGREVSDATSKTLAGKIYPYHSGPKGGDIEIATEILFGRCHIVIFFIDPLNAHPHIDDIRTVSEICMGHKRVLIITSEMHAREFMSRVVREKPGIDL